ncbi:cystathionine beta-lyase [Vreelandella nigrificans]|uniref:Cystathionine beta-lyase n=2 Tax=Vreelandella nigrificans TaxID=2042704 RepID=A0A2A4HLP7_9GAMM|nr:cystathionine beta-lyase [Halomonas nigrificans]
MTTVSPLQLKQWLFDGNEIALFDVREHGQYGAAHLFHAIPLPYSRLEIEVRRLAPNPKVRTVVYDSEGGGVSSKAAQHLRELGYQQVYQLSGGSRAWYKAGNELFAGVHVPSKAFGELVEQVRHTPHITAERLSTWQREGEPVVVLDGRPFDEYHKMNIPGGICCPNGELGYRIHDVVSDSSTPIVINCAGRTRSIIGAQTLVDLGIENPVYALENGTQGWYLADLELEHGSNKRYPETITPKQADEQRKAAWALASRHGVSLINTAKLAEWVSDQQRTLFVCDVRSPEEFAAASIPGAQSTPGGQLIQATDLYIGVRGARIVLFDDDGVRAPIVAAWLRQMGREVYVLSDSLADAIAEVELNKALAVPGALNLPELPSIAPSTLAARLINEDIALIDLRPSGEFIGGHIAGALWSTRPLVPDTIAGETRPIVLISHERSVASLTALEFTAHQIQSMQWMSDDIKEWREAGLPLTRLSDALTDEQRIDFLFFAHDRHAGNKAAARQYLDWEVGLLDQLDPLDLNRFRSAIQPQLRHDPSTLLVHSARPEPKAGGYAVNHSVSRLSTVLFDSADEMQSVRSRRDNERLLSYGARGNPTAFALEDLVSELEGGYRTKLFSTGLAAITHMFMAYLRPGDHLLITEGTYAPARRVAQQLLAPFGIEVSYFPADGRDIERHLRDNTRMVYAEVPSSLLFEFADLPAIAALCRGKSILLAVDNTWGSGYLYRPLTLGADISVMALTKYIAGHSDVLMGSVCTTEQAWSALSQLSDTVGATVSPDDAYLVLRGARTLAPRLETHQRHGLEIARWLATRPEVARVYHPALSEHPGHELWKRDFSGANGLLTFAFAEAANIDLNAFIGALQLFGLGASWGGFESLVSIADVGEREGSDTAGPFLRLHIGLESPAALIDDLIQGFMAGIRY